jgi:hypothetical protein
MMLREFVKTKYITYLGSIESSHLKDARISEIIGDFKARS